MHTTTSTGSRCGDLWQAVEQIGVQRAHRRPRARVLGELAERSRLVSMPTTAPKPMSARANVCGPWPQSRFTATPLCARSPAR